MLGEIKTLRTCRLRDWSSVTGPIEDHTLAHRREPSALEGWILEILSCDPKGGRTFLLILSTEGRGVGLSLLGEIKT